MSEAKQIAELRAALEPFARFFGLLVADDAPDEATFWTTWDADHNEVSITHGMARRAVAVMGWKP